VSVSVTAKGATLSRIELVVKSRLAVALLAVCVGLGLGLGPGLAVAEEPGSPNSVEFGLGNTHTESGEDAATIWATYQRRLNSRIGVGVLGEYAFGDLDTWVVGVPLTYHAGEHWKLVLMPGVEIEDGDSETLLRIGAGYEFEMDRYTIKPEANADFVGGDVDYVFGVSIGFGF
jgi:hypothetical protein